VALRTVGVKLTADISQYTTALARAGAATKDFTGKLDQTAKAGKLDKVADTAGVAGIALVGMAGYAIKAAADFDKAMSGVQAATHAGANEIGALRQAALQAGKDTQYSATQAAQGITELSKAGVSTADILGGGLKGALNLAAAGQLDVGEAAETAASAMTQFGLSGKDIPHVADLLAAGAGKAQGSVHDMGAALNQSGLVAAQFGLSIEDTTGVLAEFAHAGLLGSDAGTSLKTMLLALANPSKQSRAEMDQLGISFYDAQGKFVGISGVAQILQTRLKDLTVEQRNQALGQIFGNDAIRAAGVLYTDGAAGVAKWKTGVNDAGYATKTAAALTDNLAGDLERLKGSLETLAIQSGSGANGGLRVLVKGLGALANQIGSLPSAVTSTGTVLVGLTGLAALLGAAWIKARAATAKFRVELEAMGPAGVKASAGLGRTISVASKAGAVFAGLEIAGASINAAFGTHVTAQTDAFGQSLLDWADSGTRAGESARIFGKDFSRLSYDLSTLGSGFGAKFGNSLAGVAENISGLGGVMDESLQHAKERLDQVDQSLTAMVQNGQGAQAADIFGKLAEEGKKAGISVDDLKKGLPQYASASANAAVATKDVASKTGDLNSALDKGAAAQDKYKTAADAVAGAARGEREALGALFATLKAETDPVFALIDAQKKLKDAQKAYTSAVKAHGRNSAEARAADIDLAQAALGLQDSVGSLSTTFKGKLDPAFVATLRAAGLTKGQIADVAKQFEGAKKSADKYAGKYAANVSAPGAKDAKKQLDDAYTAANHFDGPYRANASAPGATNARKQLNDAYTAANHFAGPYRANVSVTGYSTAAGLLNRLSVYQQALKSGKIPAGFNGPIKGPDGKFYADGGPVGGWSPHSRADNIPAWLTANEWVHPVDSVKYYGPQLMSAIQHRQVPREVLAGFASGRLGKMGDLPLGLAGGGPVMWPFPTTAAHTRIPSRAEVESKVGGQAGPFLHAQDGKPYVWASAGPGGYDCSGIVSAVYNLLHGRSPYHHTFSTASLPGGWFTKPGIGGQLTAAWSNPGEAPASSTTGHMMGMAGGLTFESTGSRGVHLGRTTRRLTDFAHIAHYGLGGKVGGVPVFDSGGTLMPGYNTVYNATGRPEPVSPMWQNTGSGGGSVTVVLENHGVIGSRMELQTWLEGSVNDLKRKGKI
jgi:TP901 family phage tail tape measure protein